MQTREASGRLGGQHTPLRLLRLLFSHKAPSFQLLGASERVPTPLRPFQNCGTFSGYIIPGLLWFPSSYSLRPLLSFSTLDATFFSRAIILSLELRGTELQKAGWLSGAVSISHFFHLRSPDKLRGSSAWLPIRITWKLKNKHLSRPYLRPVKSEPLG